MATMLSAVPAAPSVARGSMDFAVTQMKSVEHASVTNPALATSFRAALLLTGSVPEAEAALADAIQRIDAGRVSDHSFLLDCVRASLEPGRRSEASGDSEYASSILLPELRRILMLPAHLRHSLVLRVLLGFSDFDCACLNIPDASQHARAAVEELARIREAERRMAA